MLIKNNFQKIFVTGGAGFIGSHLTDTLVQDGRSVVVYDNLSSGKEIFLQGNREKGNFEFVRGDLLDTKKLSKSLPKDTDIVFHLAANADVSKGYADPNLDFEQTTHATFNLLMEMRKKNIRHLVYFSGSGVYGDTGKKYMTENYGPLMPASMYGATKLSAEGLMSAFANLYGIQVWIFRPANIVGGRATHGVIFDFIKKLKKNPRELVILGDGKQSKSYVYVSDLLSAVFYALRKGDKPVNTYNVSTENFVTVNEIAEEVIRCMRLKNVKVQHTTGKVGWPGDIPVVRLDVKKLKETGWKPQFTSMRAVEKTVKDIIKEAR